MSVIFKIPKICILPTSFLRIFTQRRRITNCFLRIINRLFFIENQNIFMRSERLSICIKESLCIGFMPYNLITKIFSLRIYKFSNKRLLSRKNYRAIILYHAKPFYSVFFKINRVIKVQISVIVRHIL